MKLKITPLIDAMGVNDFVYATEIQSTVGTPIDLYFQLFDAEKNLSSHGWNPDGLRYMPPVNSTLQVIFQNVDDLGVINRFASQPFPQDPSIWKVTVLATDPIQGTVNMRFILTEPSGVGFITKMTALRAAFLCGVN